MPDLERRGVTSTTFTIDEKATRSDKEDAVIGPSSYLSDQMRSSTSQKRKWGIVFNTFLLLSIILFMVAWQMINKEHVG
jgi:hypothetical protein